MAQTNKGRKVYVCETPQPSDLNQAGYEGLTWVEVGNVGSVDQTGPTRTPSATTSFRPKLRRSRRAPQTPATPKSSAPAIRPMLVGLTLRWLDCNARFLTRGVRHQSTSSDLNDEKITRLETAEVIESTSEDVSIFVRKSDVSMPQTS